MPFFSIIIPLYNKEKFIENTIQSVLGQSFEDFELIVVNDGSTDTSLELVNKLKDKRIKTYSISNAGVSKARNFGIQKATSKLIVFLDADDWYEHGAVDYILEQILSRSFDLLVFDFSTVYSSGCVRKQWRPSSDGAIKDFLCDRIISTVWNKVYRVDVIFDNNIRFPAYLSEDSLFNFKFLLRCKNVSKFDSFIYFFDKSEKILSKDFLYS